MGRTADVVDTIRITHEPDGRVLIGGVDPASVSTGRGFTRDSGKERVMVSIPSLNGEAQNTVWGAITQFDYLVAVDTGETYVDGRRINVAAAHALADRITPSTREVRIVPLCAYALFDVAPHVKPETIGWYLTLTLNVLAAAEGRKVLLLTDCELGKTHEKINAREVPFYSDRYLPSKVWLGYAWDKGPELPNVMIRWCDQLAREAIKDIEQRRVRLHQPAHGDDNYSGFVQLNLAAAAKWESGSSPLR